MKDLSHLWDKPLMVCHRKGCVCQFAQRAFVIGESTCALDKCVKYKKLSRRYESNAKRPR